VCATGYGIRRSKDLRAEIGKCPISTNERKNMSTKTLRKRIALVAVAALGAGVLASAPATAAAGTAGFAAANVRIMTGSVVAPADLTSPSTAVSATMTLGGTVEVDFAATGASTAFATVSGGSITRVTTTAAKTVLLAADSLTKHVFGATATTITFAPSAVGTQMVVNVYDSSTASSSNTLTVNVVAATTVGTFDSGYSLSKVVAAANYSTISDNVDLSTAGKIANSTSAVAIHYLVKDSNNVNISSANVQAVATGGCVVSTTTTFSGSAASATGATGQFYVARGLSNTPMKCAVALSVNGAAWVTKNLTFQGKVTKVEVDGGQAGISIAKTTTTASASADAFYFSAYDAAGNAVDSIAVTTEDKASAAFTSSTAGTTDVVDGAAGSLLCSDTKGKGQFRLKHVNTSAETLYSPWYDVACNGGVYTYTASLDKASYVPGDIATLTITAKDSAGNSANDYQYLGGTAAAGFGTTNPVSIAGSNLTAITAPSSTDMFVSGVKKYKFIVGSTEGSYQLSVDLPKFNSSVSGQTAATVAYKIAGSGGVSNADVLKAIVSLIASINKQIAALQKALLKK
jgi:hypothetical protein